MKIAQVISTPPFAWATGGCARVAYELSKELANRGHDVTILTTDLYTPNQRYTPNNDSKYHDGIKIIRFKYISDILAWKHKVYLSMDLVKYLNRHISEYDLIHLQDLISIHAFATAISCKKNNIPYILSTHGSIPWLYEKNIINFIYNFVCGKLILKYASKILASNEVEANQCKKIGINENKLEIVPNGAPLFNLESLPRKGEFREKYSITLDEKIILYLGRLHEIKGIGLLIDAFSDLGDNPKIKLVIVGPDDGYLEELKDKIVKFKIQNKVVLTGPLYDNDKAGAYIDADVYVLPSRYECFPISVLEACFFEIPVIITNRCGIADSIEGKCGFAIDYNKDKLKEALASILNNPELSRSFGKAGRRLVETRFNWTSVATQIEGIYLKCIFKDD